MTGRERGLWVSTAAPSPREMWGAEGVGRGRETPGESLGPRRGAGGEWGGDPASIIQSA